MALVPLQVLHEFSAWKAVDGEHQGEVVAPQCGLVVLRWSNEPLSLRFRSLVVHMGAVKAMEAAMEAAAVQ